MVPGQPDRYGNGAQREEHLPRKIHYFEDGEREELLLPGCGSHYEMLSRFTDIPERYRTAKGMYFFKDVDEPYWEQAKNWLGSYSGISCWEIAGNAAVHECKDAIADRLSYVDLFSLNLTEGKRITGETEPLRVVDVLRQMHADNVILRMGAKGRAGSQGRRSLGDSSGACQCGGRDRRRQFLYGRLPGRLL